MQRRCVNGHSVETGVNEEKRRGNGHSVETGVNAEKKMWQWSQCRDRCQCREEGVTKNINNTNHQCTAV